jgi:hypothetical protein
VFCKRISHYEICTGAHRFLRKKYKEKEGVLSWEREIKKQKKERFFAVLMARQDQRKK